jgi:hypothetical protein
VQQSVGQAGKLDLGGVRASIVLVPEEQRTRVASRYDTIIATFVGICALGVAGYTAYMQRQQVRAAVWPILQFDSSNDPDIHLTLSNKGVGPAIIRHVTVTVDGQPVRNWREAIEKMLGPGPHPFSESDMRGHVLSAGEEMTIFTPRDSENNPIVYNRSNPLWIEVDKDRFRIAVEICYCSTLGECWTLRSDARNNVSTTETSRCPGSSATTFQQ